MPSHTFNNKNIFKATSMCWRLKRGKLHLAFEIESKRIVYCYIRKNASSAFKKLIIASSPFSDLVQPHDNSINFLFRHHKSSFPQDISNADHTIFVYRDPIERIVSLFKNKFIQQIGASDILKNYSKITGRDSRNDSFRDFVNYYLTSGFSNLGASEK